MKSKLGLFGKDSVQFAFENFEVDGLDDVSIEREVLLQFDDLQMEGQPDILIEVIDSFLETSIPRIEAMERFALSNDAANAAKEAHALKSGAQLLGAMTLGRYCQEIENFKENNSEKLVQLFHATKEALALACKELSEIKLEQAERRKAS